MNAKASPCSPPARPASSARPRSRWDWHYRALLAAKKRLLREFAEREREAAEAGDGAAEESRRSSDQLTLDTSVALLAIEAGILDDIEDALLRIKRGSYGYCVASGRRIPRVRLRAVPWCRYTREIEQSKNGGAKGRAP